MLKGIIRGNIVSTRKQDALIGSKFMEVELRSAEVIACDKKGKTNLYYPLLKQSEYDLSETENFLSKIYKGSVKNLVATLYENKKLSNEDMSDLKKMFELE